MSILLPVSGARDMVYDPVHNNVDITTKQGTLQVFNLTNQTLQQFGIGASPAGADISADGKTLIVADQGIPNPQQVLHRIDLQSMQEYDFVFPSYSGSGATWDVALGPGSKGLFDGSSSINSARLQQLDFNSGYYTWRQDATGSKGKGLIGSNTLIHRSADRSTFLVADTGSPKGTLFTYNALTDTFSGPVTLGFSLAGANTAVNRNGTLMAVQVNGTTYVLNRNLAVVQSFSGLDGGVAFDPTQDFMYVVSSGSGQILTFDTNTWGMRLQLPVGEAVPRGTPLGNGTMMVTPNGWLFLTTPSGVRGYQLPPVPGVVTSFVVSGAPASVAAGSMVNFTVTAVDGSGKPVPFYGGTVHFTTSDFHNAVPPDYTFTPNDQGTHSFFMPFYTSGAQTVSVADTINANLKGTLQPAVQVVAGPARNMGTCYTGSSVYGEAAGYSIPFVVSVYDIYGNPATSYTGTMHFTSSDPAAQLPADYTFTAADQGQHAFYPVLNTAGYQSITTSDAANGLSITTSHIQVSNVIPGLHFTVSPATTTTSAGGSVSYPETAGTPFAYTVTAWDYNNQVATHYVGSVRFLSSDYNAGTVLPADYTFTAADAGVHTFSVTLATAGSQAVSVQDTSFVSGSSQGSYGASFTVSPAAASTFKVAGFPAAVTAGGSGNFTVTAYDPYGNKATGYAGTVHFTSSDAGASLPADATLAGGTATFSATLTTAGTQSLTATDTANAALSGTEAGIAVSPAAAAVLVLNVPGTVTAGSPFTFTVTVEDAYGNVTTGYVGTVHFSGSDAAAGLPADYTFGATDAGTATFSAVFNTAGNQTLTVTDDLNNLSATLGVLVLTS